MKRLPALIACTALLALALYFLLRAPTQSQPEQPSTTKAAAQATDTPPSSIGSGIKSAPTQVARSTRILDFELNLDARGNLVPGPEVRELFDAIARQQGQIPADQWKQSILDAYDEQLGPLAREQLQALLNRYIEYNLALQLLPMDGVASLRDALQRVQQIRSEYIGQDSAALFSDWQQVEAFTNQFVQQTMNYQDAAQLQQSLQEQVYSLPPTVQPRAQRILQNSEDLFTALGSGQPDPAVVKSIAEQVAALALVQPDFTFGEPSPEFMEQYHQYTRAKQALLQQGSIDSENAPQLEALRQQYFSGSDRLRVKTLDRADMY